MRSSCLSKGIIISFTILSLVLFIFGVFLASWISCGWDVIFLDFRRWTRVFKLSIQPVFLLLCFCGVSPVLPSTLVLGGVWEAESEDLKPVLVDIVSVMSHQRLMKRCEKYSNIKYDKKKINQIMWIHTEHRLELLLPLNSVSSRNILIAAICEWATTKNMLFYYLHLITHTGNDPGRILRSASMWGHCCSIWIYG